MSTLDEYEYRRGPVRRRFRGRKPKRQAPGAKAKPRDVQMALKLMPFDDPIPF